MRIAIIGYCGAGKSTLARALADRCGCPALFLDTVNFESGWRERGRDEARAIVRTFLDENPAWVIDGNYGALLQAERLAAADLIVFFDFPRLACLSQAVFRYLRFRGKTRESIADGCIEKLDWEFLWWILYKGRTAPRRKHYHDIVEAYGEKTVVLKNRAAVRRFLAGFSAEQREASAAAGA